MFFAFVMNIRYIGKTILLEINEEKILVVGDLHLGLGQAIREGGVFLPVNLYKEVKSDLEKIFMDVGKVQKVVLLGDLKHEFGQILWDEWKEVLDFIEYLRENCEEIIIIKGNHDVFTDKITKKREVKVVDYFVLGKNAFLHGDRSFDEIEDKKVKKWFMGHGHPAVVISEGIKKEKYKCFLHGTWKGREVFILPSFSGINEGTDAREFDLGMAWDFNLENFEVKVVDEENLKVLDFGKLKSL